MKGISLTFAMRNNLLSLQAISRQISSTQNRLSIGKKVNSAIDNPSSYYAAVSLENRAKDLNELLNGISQGIQTVKAATTALQSGSALLQQAATVAAQSLENTYPAANPDVPVGPDIPVGPDTPTVKIAATVTNERELLDAVNNTTAADGVIVVANDIVMSKNTGITLKDGQKLVGQNYVDGKGGMPKLMFDFQADNRSSGQGIALAQDSELSDLSIEYTSSFKIDSNSSSCVFNNGYTGIRLNNLNISYVLSVPSGGYNGAIRNIGNGEITLDGTININVTGGIEHMELRRFMVKQLSSPKSFNKREAF